MSQYKSQARSKPQHESSQSPYRNGARQLQELFPAWSNDDLVQLLTDLNGDVTLAATKITDGAVEPWGEVSHKKDKKGAPPVHSSKPSTSGRGDFRGARGGRGGRGGPGRGGAVTRGRGGPPKASGTNGYAHHAEGSSINGASSTTPAEFSKPAAQDASPKVPTESLDIPNGSNFAANDSFSQADSQFGPASGAPSGWGSASEAANGSVASLSSKHPTKTPATSKLSWAQIARPLEKPTPPVAPPTQASATTTAPASSQPPAPASPPPEPQPEPQESSWEEPTTVEQPSWDDPIQTKVADDWSPSTAAESVPVVEPPKAETPAIPSPEVKAEPVEANPPPPAPEPVPEPPAEPKVAPAAVISALPAQVTATPSPKLTSRPAAVSHRNSARHKIPDQPVTLPISFGSGIEKVGMQFGSLNLGDVAPETQNEPEVPSVAPEPAPAPVVPQAKPQIEAPTTAPAPPATAPAASNSLSSVFQHQQQQVPTPQQPIPTQPLHATQPTVSHHLPTSISQPIPTSQSSSFAAASPLQQFAQQHQVIPTQSPLVTASTQQLHQPHHIQQQSQQQSHVPHLPQQLQQNQSLHSYAQHSLPGQLEASQQAQAPVQQSIQSTAHANYFRSSEASNSSPYFQTPTPPVSQSQDTAYGSFGQLGTQAQHQQQGSHLGNFNNNEYAYNENARGFYDSYSQQQSFASRNPLGHEDVKGLASSGQQPTSSALPPSSTQGPQSHTAQTSNQPQPNTPQGPQQSYPPPVPYYYTHAYPQNQYYGSPYSSGYVPQPFVKYPTMFQPGPPGPGSTGNPTSKQPANLGAGVQHQTNPYNQTLYQQGGYDEYQGHPHHSQHQHNHSLGLAQGGIGANSSDYGKPLYGGGAQTGMQGFMGLGGQSGSGSSGPVSNAGPRSSTSPEAVYKPYASKDVGVSSGRGAPGQQAQAQAQPQAQNQGPTGQGMPPGQGFYSANRFSGNVTAASAGGATQQGGPQGHLGYPQGVNDNFYGYQPRQQQGYWQ